jgi:pimeloyl-ACP methyl ester carboxylesterase
LLNSYPDPDISGWFSSKALVTAVAGALAATDPDRALRVAQSITDESSKATALAAVAGALAATHPDRAARLLSDAERIAQSITTDPRRAARVIPDP